MPKNARRQGHRSHPGLRFLTPAQTDAYRSFTEQVMSRVDLSGKDTRLLEEDILNAYTYFLSCGMSPDRSLARIGKDIFGDFYSPPDINEWFALDSAAKVYPLSMTRNKMSVFRIGANMRSEVIPPLLQLALDSTIRRFPTFATSLKRGLFWHYLDASRKRFVVSKEENLPCAPLKISSAKDQVFRLVYFGNRISMEVFHCVADGYGAMVFLKTLLNEYLRLTGEPPAADIDIFDISATPDAQESCDAFPLTDKATTTAGYGNGRAIQLAGRRSRWQPAQVIHFVMPASQLTGAAKELGTTVSGLLVCAMILAAKSSAPVKAKTADGTFRIQLPVNMRQYYPVMTLRNFSMYATIEVPYADVQNLEQLAGIVGSQIRSRTSKESLDKMATMTNKLVTNKALRFVPLGLKGVIISRIVSMVTGKSFTGVLSNLGVVRTDFGDNIESFEAISGPSGSNQLGCGLISYRGTTVLSITKTTMNHTFESKIHEILASLGVEILIEGNSV